MEDGAHHRTVRVLVMGDSGVGKSEFVSELCGMSKATKGGTGLQAWVSVEGGLGGTKDVIEFVELCGDTSYHKSVRWPMYKNVDAVILVYDLTDDSSAFSLKQWQSSFDDYTAEQSNTVGLQHDVEAMSARTAVPESLRTRGGGRSCVASPQAIPILVVGTHSDAVQRTRRNHVSIWRKISRTLLAFQRTMASILRQVLFLPMPSFLFSAGEKEQVLEELKSRNTHFMEYSSQSKEDKPERLQEAKEFLSTLLESVHPTI